MKPRSERRRLRTDARLQMFGAVDGRASRIALAAGENAERRRGLGEEEASVDARLARAWYW